MTTNNLSAGTQTSHDQALNKAIFNNLDTAKQYINHIKKAGVQWDNIGFLSDASYHNLMTLLFNGGELIDVFRFSLQHDDNEKLVSYISDSYIVDVRLKVSEKEEFSLEDFQSQESFKSLWDETRIGSKKLNAKETTKLFKRWSLGREKVTGRGNKFSQLTKRIVMEDSHGRCMFSGCGSRLDFDSLSGHRGNFGYMAHNIAASESGPRGVIYLSKNLADEPSNVLLLCDVHHRLVDRIASLDYPAPKLQAMRTIHIQLCNNLLNALSYTPVPIYFIPWSVNGQSIEVPNPISISKSLSVVNCRAKHDLTPLEWGVSDSMQNSYEFHRRCELC